MPADILPCCMGDNVVEESLGWRCRVCGTFYPHGCEPWTVDDADPCPFCGEPACERSCTGALLADAGEDAPC